MRDLNSQELANTAWAFATISQSDERLLTGLARDAERRMNEFKAQNLANAAWAFCFIIPAQKRDTGLRILKIFEISRMCLATS